MKVRVEKLTFLHNTFILYIIITSFISIKSLARPLFQLYKKLIAFVLLNEWLFVKSTEILVDRHKSTGHSTKITILSHVCNKIFIS
jgi:hypothetical protein